MDSMYGRQASSTMDFLDLGGPSGVGGGAMGGMGMMMPGLGGPYDKEIPNEFMCPITGEIMMEPVIASDGETYDRSGIEAWMRGWDTSPITTERLAHKWLTPNRNMARCIQMFREKIDQSERGRGLRRDGHTELCRQELVAALERIVQQMPDIGGAEGLAGCIHRALATMGIRAPLLPTLEFENFFAVMLQRLRQQQPPLQQLQQLQQMQQPPLQQLQMQQMQQMQMQQQQQQQKQQQRQEPPVVVAISTPVVGVTAPAAPPPAPAPAPAAATAAAAAPAAAPAPAPTPTAAAAAPAPAPQPSTARGPQKANGHGQAPAAASTHAIPAPAPAPAAPAAWKEVVKNSIALRSPEAQAGHANAPAAPAPASMPPASAPTYTPQQLAAKAAAAQQAAATMLAATTKIAGQHNTRLAYPNGDVYEGQGVHRAGSRTGKPMFLKHGKGVWTGVNGDVYDGYYVDDKRNGKGWCKWANGDTYTGDWLNGTKHGVGQNKWVANGDVKEYAYDGQFENNKEHGEGTLRWADSKTEYTGEFRNGKMHGMGTLKNFDTGNVIKSGQWLRGEYVSSK